ncbi:hypothetical protein QZH41_019374 [Actinostola sp. cb2023]|nr:hypothetical protein QZH41_019374 [Actinostola sp. cb2023]
MITCLIEFSRYSSPSYKNQVKAVRRMVFSKIKECMDVRKVEETGNQAFEVDLHSVVVWAIRQQRLHQLDSEEVELNIKLDGRALGGRDQVLIGLVPINNNISKSQSSKAVYPLVMANCKEQRWKEIEVLLKKLNVQKNVLKKKGITVDGKHYKVKFSVTADYKALSLLMKKKCDENFKLGGKGMDTEFCLYCVAIRGCSCKITDDGDACMGCIKDCFSRSKANIGSWTGIRDDLLFILDEEISSVMLCSLHCEMRNTEQLLGSVGLFAHKCSALVDFNTTLSSYGPESFKEKRITVKLHPGQESAVEKGNIKVATFSGICSCTGGSDST